MGNCICVHCGDVIMRHAVIDPCICRDCEKVLDGIESEKDPFLSRVD